MWVFREWGWCATLVRRGLDARVTSLGSVTFGVMELIPSTIHLISTTFTGQWLQTVSLKSGIAIGLLLNSAWVAVRYHSTCTRSVGTLGHCSQIFVLGLHISQANPFRKTRNLHVVWVWFFLLGFRVGSGSRNTQSASSVFAASRRTGVTSAPLFKTGYVSRIEKAIVLDYDDDLPLRKTSEMIKATIPINCYASSYLFCVNFNISHHKRKEPSLRLEEIITFGKGLTEYS